MARAFCLYDALDVGVSWCTLPTECGEYTEDDVFLSYLFYLCGHGCVANKR